jgi:hypothetical protein
VPLALLPCAGSELAARSAATALAVKLQHFQVEPAINSMGTPRLSNTFPTKAELTQPVPPKHTVHYFCAVLIVRIYKVFTLLCALCGEQMRVSFLLQAQYRHPPNTGVHLCREEPPCITSIRKPPPLNECDAQITMASL